VPVNWVWVGKLSCWAGPQRKCTGLGRVFQKSLSVFERSYNETPALGVQKSQIASRKENNSLGEAASALRKVGKEEINTAVYCFRI
jgi:hypothetical protein